ncbi:MAG: ABC transporter transmembrane domain-containing protein [Pseudomonadota bacterium]
MERTLLHFVWNHSWRWQLLIVLASFLSFPLILATLYVPKEIVNEALGGTSFPYDVYGFEFEQLPYLFLLCGVLIVLIFANNGVKFYINISKGLTGERILRRMRFTIYDRVSRLPLKRLRSTSPGEVVQVVTAEVEPIGGFAGQIIATPVYVGGQLIVYLGFIVAQDPVLGLAAIVLFPVQAYIIPKIQRVVVRLVQRRIRNVRQMTTDISETVTGIEEMRLADARQWHLARLSERLYFNFNYRYRIFLLKYAIKFLNNIFNNITPFFFYGFGGYLVIEGRMDLGALVAILAAYKDIAAPWRELLNYYQGLSDISARYDAVLQAFGNAPLEAPLAPVSLDGRTVTLAGIRAGDPPAQTLQDIALSLPAGSLTLIIGEEESGRPELMRLCAGLLVPSSGEIRLRRTGGPGGRVEPAGETAGQTAGQMAGETVHETVGGPELLTRAARDIAYVNRAPHMIRGTLRENVAYGLLGNTGSGAEPADWAKRVKEARMTGTLAESPDLDWVDYARVGLEGAADFDAQAVETLAALGLERELYARGLTISIDPLREPELARSALAARSSIANTNAFAKLDGLVEHWDRSRYLENFSLAENLFFGVPDSPISPHRFAHDPAVKRALRSAGVEMEVAEIGLAAARVLTELTAGLAEGTRLLDRIGLIEPSEREEVSGIVTRARRGAGRLGRADRDKLIRLGLQIVPQRHRLGVIDDAGLRARLVAARSDLRKAYRPARPFTFFDSDGYVPGVPLIENILCGRPRIDRRDAKPPVESRLDDALVQHDMHDFVLRAGLRTEVTFGGNNLSSTQRRMLGLARALLSRPALLVLDGIVDDGGEDSQAIRRAIRRHLPDAAIVMGSGQSDVLREADAAYRITAGRLEPLSRPDRLHKGGDGDIRRDGTGGS